jgi:hypothetical protein
LSDEKPDEKTERMRRIYARLADDEVALARDLAHPFKGDGPSCDACHRGPDHPFHERAEPEGTE